MSCVVVFALLFVILPFDRKEANRWQIAIAATIIGIGGWFALA
jgi:hypothetical protein